MGDDNLSRRSLVFLLSSLALIALPHAWHLSSILFGFFSLLMIWRFVAVWHKQWLPNRWLLYALTMAGIALLVMLQRGLFGRDAGTSLFVVALGLKLMEIRGQRDVFVIVYLAFIVAASQFLYEQSIWMAAYILLICSLLLATLIIQIAGQVSTLAAVKTSVLIILQALPLAVMIFILFPRLEAPRWMWLMDEHSALSGLSATLEPGSISDLSLSDELVFRVRFKGQIPPPNLRYWRGPVYSNTDGVQWSIAAKRSEAPAEIEFSGETYQYTLMMEPQKEDWVFGLEMPDHFDRSLRRDATLLLHTRKRFSERVQYLLSSRPHYKTGAMGKAERAENLQLPSAATARQLALIETLGGLTSKPESFIRNLLNYFRQEKFYYTLTPPLMPDNPIDTFLFETRSGYCSHYATAFVYLLRIAKIPARVVGGYQGGEINEVGGFLEVRQADAHAWAEAWFDDKGWVRFDPTAAIAPERIERGINVDLQIASGAVSFSPLVADSAALDWLKRGRQLWQSIDYNWQRWVINYDTGNQTQLLNSLGIADMVTLVKWLVASVIAIVLPLAWWLLKGTVGSTDRAVRYYRRFCAKLAKTGLSIDKGEGPIDFSLRVKSRYPNLASDVDRITTLFVRLRYQPDANADDLKLLRAAVGRLKLK